MTTRSRSIQAVAVMVAMVVISGLTAACTGSGGSQPKGAALGTPAARPAPSGSVSGVVAACTGLADAPPRAATVFVLRGGSPVATAHVVAGQSGHDRYLLTLAAGQYTVRASNWPTRRLHVSIRPGGRTTADFPDDCD